MSVYSTTTVLLPGSIASRSWVYVCVNIRVLVTLDQVAAAITEVDEVPFVEVQPNVVVEVVARDQTVLQRDGLTTTMLGGSNVVFLPPALFVILPNVNNTMPRISVVSIDNRNLLPPRTRNNRLRATIISVNVDTRDIRNLGNDQRIELTFDRVCITQHYSAHSCKCMSGVCHEGA